MVDSGGKSGGERKKSGGLGGLVKEEGGGEVKRGEANGRNKLGREVGKKGNVAWEGGGGEMIIKTFL